jgi:glycosyltransferase involved in cell wall biosynthesis
LSKKQDRARVSIGLPVFNGARFIAETLDSLLAQTYKDFELIICDNASTDQTEQICLTYQAKDKRIKYYRNTKNLGATKNYRKTFELSSGEYYRWANADDVFSPMSLARCIEILDADPTVVLTFPKTRFIDEQGQFIGDYEKDLDLRDDKAIDRFRQVLERLEKVNCIYGLARADVLKKTKLIRNIIPGDRHIMAELSLYGKCWKIPEYLFYRRLHNQAYSSLKNDELCQEFFDPSKKGKFLFNEWKHLLGYFDSVIMSPLNINEKMRLIVYLLRKAKLDRKRLATELFEDLYKIVRNFSNF